MEKEIGYWAGECMRKSKLKESWADRIILKEKRENNKTMHKYYCCHCQHWHISSIDKRIRE